MMKRHYRTPTPVLCLTPPGSCAGESAYLLTEAIVGEWTDRSLPSEQKLSELMVGALERSPGR